MTKDTNDPEKDDESGSKVYTFRVPNRDTKLIEFFVELDKANGAVKSLSDWTCQTVVAASKQRLAEMTPQAIEEEARRRHAEVEADKARSIEIYNTFMTPPVP